MDEMKQEELDKGRLNVSQRKSGAEAGGVAAGFDCKDDGSERSRLGNAVLNAIAPISLALALVVIVFCPFQYWEYSGKGRQLLEVSILDMIVVAALLGVWALVRKGKLVGPGCGHVLAFTLAALVLGDALGSMYLLQEPFYSVFVIIIPMGAAIVMLSTRWLLALLVLTVGGWLFTVWMMGDSFASDYFMHFGFALLISSMCALFFLFNRVKAFVDLEKARRDEQAAREKTATALEAAEKEIRDRKRAEEERDRIQARMLQAQKQESLGVLAGSVAHDFNNLLTAVIGSTDLALEQVDDGSELQGLLSTIRASAQRGAELSMQMLHYSGKGHFLMQPVDIGLLVKRTAVLLGASISKKAELVYDIPRSLPKVEADVSQIRQLVVNLVVNASEALDDKEGRIEISIKPVILKQEDLSELILGENMKPGRFLCLTVKDTGLGMTNEVMEKVFDPFFTTKFPGRGLGLAAVLGIVRGHRGGLKVGSEPGKGSSFKVFLPCLEEVSERDVLPSRDSVKYTEHGEVKGKVLVVDDEESVRKISRRLFEKVGMEVMEASSGKEALEMVRKHGRDLDLVVLDESMQDLSGHEVLETLKTEHPDLLVVLSSGFTREYVEVEQEALKADGFLAKPYDSKKIRELLAGLGLASGSGSRISDMHEDAQRKPL